MDETNSHGEKLETAANARQVGGDHYAKDGEQHWDRMWRLYGRGYFIGNITKYVERYHKKNGLQDLDKAAHYLQKLIELEKEHANRPDSIAFDCVRGILGKYVRQFTLGAAGDSKAEPGNGYVNQ